MENNLTLKDYIDRILKPSVDSFLCERGQTVKEFIEETEALLRLSKRILEEARDKILNNDQ